MMEHIIHDTHIKDWCTCIFVSRLIVRPQMNIKHLWHPPPNWNAVIIELWPVRDHKVCILKVFTEASPHLRSSQNWALHHKNINHDLRGEYLPCAGVRKSNAMRSAKATEGPEEASMLLSNGQRGSLSSVVYNGAGLTEAPESLQLQTPNHRLYAPSKQVQIMVSMKRKSYRRLQEALSSVFIILL